MVVSPHGHKLWASYEKTYVNAQFFVVTNGHNESQIVTNVHQAPTPAHPSGHKRSKSHQAPGASASRRSQMVTKSHQARVPAHPGGHKWSQNRTRPECQRILAVTHGHKIAPSTDAGTSWRSQMVTKSHQIPTPMRPGGHTKVTKSHRATVQAHPGGHPRPRDRNKLARTRA